MKKFLSILALLLISNIDSLTASANATYKRKTSPNHSEKDDKERRVRRKLDFDNLSDDENSSAAAGAGSGAQSRTGAHSVYAPSAFDLKLEDLLHANSAVDSDGDTDMPDVNGDAEILKVLAEVDPNVMPDLNDEDDIDDLILSMNKNFQYLTYLVPGRSVKQEIKEDAENKMLDFLLKGTKIPNTFLNDTESLKLAFEKSLNTVGVKSSFLRNVILNNSNTIASGYYSDIKPDEFLVSDKYNMNALMWAVIRNNWDTLSEVFKLGAAKGYNFDLLQENSNGENALDLARCARDANIFKEIYNRFKPFIKIYREAITEGSASVLPVPLVNITAEYVLGGATR